MHRPFHAHPPFRFSVRGRQSRVSRCQGRSAARPCASRTSRRSRRHIQKSLARSLGDSTPAEIAACLRTETVTTTTGRMKNPCSCMASGTASQSGDYYAPWKEAISRNLQDPVSPLRRNFHDLLYDDLFLKHSACCGRVCRGVAKHWRPRRGTPSADPIGNFYIPRGLSATTCV